MWDMTLNGKVQVCSSEVSSSNVTGAKQCGVTAFTNSTGLAERPAVFGVNQKNSKASVSSPGSSLHFHYWDEPGTVTMTTLIYFWKGRERMGRIHNKAGYDWRGWVWETEIQWGSTGERGLRHWGPTVCGTTRSCWGALVEEREPENCPSAVCLTKTTTKQTRNKTHMTPFTALKVQGYIQSNCVTPPAHCHLFVFQPDGWINYNAITHE